MGHTVLYYAGDVEAGGHLGLLLPGHDTLCGSGHVTWYTSGHVTRYTWHWSDHRFVRDVS